MRELTRKPFRRQARTSDVIKFRCLPSSVRSPDSRHEFSDFFALIGLIAARNRMLHAMGYVIFQHFFFDASQCGTNCGDLRYDIDAIAIFIHHLGETADLALDAAKPFLAGTLDVFSHSNYIPLPGIGCNRQRRFR